MSDTKYCGCATKEIDLDHWHIPLRERTYAAMSSGYLSEDLKTKSSDLDNLPGITANQIIVAGKADIPLNPDDDIAKLMRVTRTQIELIAQETMQCDDLSTLSPVGKLISLPLANPSSVNFMKSQTFPMWARPYLKAALR